MSKSLMRSIKNVTNGYSSNQIKVRNATSNDPWGPVSTDMNEIAQCTFDPGSFVEIMDMIERRMNDKGKNWRHVMKALVVLDYCIHVGSEDVVRWAKDNTYIIKTLREFQYIDEEGRDQGANVRAKAKDLTVLLLDDERIRTERVNRDNMRNKMGQPGDSMFNGGSHASRPYEHRALRRIPVQSDFDNDEDFRKALEESKLTAAEEEARRRERHTFDNVEDEDMARAIKLSEQEATKEQQRAYFDTQNSNLLFDEYAPRETASQQFAQTTGYPQSTLPFQLQSHSTGYQQSSSPFQTKQYGGNNNNMDLLLDVFAPSQSASQQGPGASGQNAYSQYPFPQSTTQQVYPQKTSQSAFSQNTSQSPFSSHSPFTTAATSQSPFSFSQATAPSTSQELSHSAFLFSQPTALQPVQSQLTGFSASSPPRPLQQQSPAEIFGHNTVFDPAAQHPMSTGFLQNAYSSSPFQVSSSTGNGGSTGQFNAFGQSSYSPQSYLNSEFGGRAVHEDSAAKRSNNPFAKPAAANSNETSLL
ncbi:uncharacterized protein V1513DRAFT_454159 [Lipomyces chichibuensis]|uniref:uncharacterized protein n=1 Tax=Lipomyces chichibuensis TaxID=1546026 RepID=UPI00334396F3